MQVLEDQAQRLLVGELADELEEDLERPRLDALAVELPDCLRRLGLEREADEVGDERVGLVRLLPAEEVGQLGLQLEPDAGLRGRGADAEPLAQELSDGPVREGLCVGDAARLDEAHAVAIAVAHLPDEAGLADPGLAHDGDDRAATLDERVHRPLEDGQLEVAPDDRQARRRGLRLADPRDAEDVERLAHALDVLRPELLEVEASLDLSLRRRADEDASPVGQLLQAGRDVDGVPERSRGRSGCRRPAGRRRRRAPCSRRSGPRAGRRTPPPPRGRTGPGRAGWRARRAGRARRRPHARRGRRRRPASRRRRAAPRCRRSGGPARS